MSKKHQKTNNENQENKNSNNNDELEEMKNELQQEDEKEQLLEQIKLLEKDVEKYKQIASNTQSQYMTLKTDFESYKNRIESKEKEQKTNIFIDSVKWLISLVEELRITVENVPEELKDNSWANGVVVLYKNLLKKLEEMNVYQIDSIWKDLNENYHEPISSEDADDGNKWKIMKEFEKLYVYKDWDNEYVVKPAKVIVGK